MNHWKARQGLRSTPLTTLLDTAPEQAYGLKIDQVLSLCGNDLRDGNECSKQLREFLQAAPSDRLEAYTKECLERKLECGGLVLQDLVNELGRRLGYQVEDGLYKGRKDRIGHDGVWRYAGEAVVVEVKTTDTYRINLDQFNSYRERLIREGQIPTGSSILIVVGREDTGDLEAQVRGSRHAWYVRMISVESLVKLAKIRERTELSTQRQIHELLVPFEYTKLDRIIDIVFDVAEDASAGIEEEPSLESGEAEPDSMTAETGSSVEAQNSSEIIETTRLQIVSALGNLHRPLIRQGRVSYWSADKRVRAVIVVSSRHSRPWPYWYAYHPRQHEFLQDAKEGLFVLGCVGCGIAFAVPYGVMNGLLSRMRTTTLRNGKHYWHIDLSCEKGENPALGLVNPRERFEMSRFQIHLS